MASTEAGPTMRRILILLVASTFIAADGKKRLAGGRSLDKKSSVSTPKANVKPADKQGSRFVVFHTAPYRIPFQSTPYKTPYNASPRIQGGIHSATVDAKVIGESMGEGGYFVGPSAYESKTDEVRSTVQDKPPRGDDAEAGFKTTGAGAQPQTIGLQTSYQGMLLPQIAPGPSVSQSAGSFLPKYLQDYRHRNQPGSNLFQGGGFPGQGFYRTPSLVSQFFGNAGVNYGYHPDETYKPPTSYRDASVYGPRDGFQNSAVNWQANNRLGAYGSGPGQYGTQNGLYGAQSGGSIFGNPPNLPYTGTARELPLKRRKQESSKTSAQGPKPGTPINTAPPTEGKIPKMLLEQLLSVKGKPKLYKNIRDIKWSTVKVNANGFTVIAEFTSVVPPDTFQCTAIVTGSKISNVMRLNGNESNLDCNSQKRQAPQASPLQAATSRNAEPRTPVASRGFNPTNVLGYQDTVRQRESLGVYANKYGQAINPAPYGYPYFQYMGNPYGLLMG